MTRLDANTYPIYARRKLSQTDSRSTAFLPAPARPCGSTRTSGHWRDLLSRPSEGARSERSPGSRPVPAGSSSRTPACGYQTVGNDLGSTGLDGRSTLSHVPRACTGRVQDGQGAPLAGVRAQSGVRSPLACSTRTPLGSCPADLSAESGRGPPEHCQPVQLPYACLGHQTVGSDRAAGPTANAFPIQARRKLLPPDRPLSAGLCRGDRRSAPRDPAHTQGVAGPPADAPMPTPLLAPWFRARRAALGDGWPVSRPPGLAPRHLGAGLLPIAQVGVRPGGGQAGRHGPLCQQQPALQPTPCRRTGSPGGTHGPQSPCLVPLEWVSVREGGRGRWPVCP